MTQTPVGGTGNPNLGVPVASPGLGGGRLMVKTGDNATTGHGCAVNTKIALGSPNVFVNGMPAGVVGQTLTEFHAVGTAPPFCNSHAAPITGPGATKVKINGQPASVTGDNVDSGVVTAIPKGSPVFAL